VGRERHAIGVGIVSLSIGARISGLAVGVGVVGLAVGDAAPACRWHRALRDRDPALGRIYRKLDRIDAENTRNPDAPGRYAVSSLFLHECFKKLTAGPEEQFFFITSSAVESVHVLDQCAEFAHQRRSRVGIVADMPSTHNVLLANLVNRDP
jgi:hypothetical protein